MQGGVQGGGARGCKGVWWDVRGGAGRRMAAERTRRASRHAPHGRSPGSSPRWTLTSRGGRRSARPAYRCPCPSRSWRTLWRGAPSATPEIDRSIERERERDGWIDGYHEYHAPHGSHATRSRDAGPLTAHFYPQPMCTYLYTPAAHLAASTRRAPHGSSPRGCPPCTAARKWPRSLCARGSRPARGVVAEAKGVVACG